MHITQVLSLPVLNGWGLTETSPVLACRRSVPPRENVRGSVGLPIPGTQVRVVDPETLAPLGEGERVSCPASHLLVLLAHAVLLLKFLPTLSTLNAPCTISYCLVEVKEMVLRL